MFAPKGLGDLRILPHRNRVVEDPRCYHTEAVLSEMLSYRDSLCISGCDSTFRIVSWLLSNLRGINIRDMFTPIRLGDLRIFHIVTGLDKTETSLYLDDLLLLGRNKCPRCNTEMFLD
jgi:hypothetical protein